MAPCGAIPVSALVLVAMLYHDPVVTMMVPIAIVMPIVIPVVMVTAAALDHNLFGVGNRRRRDGDRADGGNNASKLLHRVLLHK
jgi:hypothetical protein